MKFFLLLFPIIALAGPSTVPHQDVRCKVRRYQADCNVCQINTCTDGSVEWDIGVPICTALQCHVTSSLRPVNPGFWASDAGGSVIHRLMDPQH